jgi:two-component system, NtrC family, response regulator AtoC
MASVNLSGLTVLVVEDDSVLRKRIVARLDALGGDLVSVDSVAEARSLLSQRNFDFAFLDVHLPDGRGTDLLEEKAFPAATGVIVVTAHGGVAGAVEAMRFGAVDYLVKPFDLSELAVAIQRAQAIRQAARLGEQRRQEIESEGLFFGSALVGLEAQLQKIVEADRRMISELPPVLIEGETGSGKTTFARWLHEHGPRANRALVEVNCSALPESLAESELFGHERGAFTDAKATRLGLFEAAGGGTLLLDEVPSLSLGLQAKVLTAIEDRTIRRVGGTKSLAVDVRIVAASNRNLREAVAQGQFREDLYHRLDLYRLSVPPLRDRGEDILRLAERMVERLCHRQRLPIKSITPIGRRRLLAYHWPGNVRELAHELERAIVFEDGSELGFPQLGPGGEEPQPAAPAPDWLSPDYDFTGFSLEGAIDRFVQLAMQRTNGNVSAAGRLLKVPRDYIRYRLYGPRTKKRDAEDGQ